MKICDALVHKYIIPVIMFVVTIGLLAGCGKKPEPDIRYITNTEKVYITIPCESEVKVRCNWKDSTDTGVVSKMLVCIADQKLSIEFCKPETLKKHAESVKAYNDKNATK